jgi:hypothetical protein
MRVALRDASVYRTHRLTDGATLQHVPYWHAIDPDNPYLSRCGRPIAPESEQEHTGTLLRCSRPGCKQAFASALDEKEASA